MNRVLNFLRKLNWYVLFAIPVLSALFGIVNNLRVPENQRVIWSGMRLDKVPEEIVTHDVKRGVWTSNFVAATNAAEMAHLPVVVAVLLPGCADCKRFHKEALSEEVIAWQKNLGWYFVMVNASEAHAVARFVKSTPVRNKSAPYMGVYWSRADGPRVMKNFPGKSKHMGVPPEPSLGKEWMHAVEASVPGAPGASFIPNGVQISVRAESEKPAVGLGRVKMSPKVDIILPGQKVVLTATPQKKEAVFVGWRYPDGTIVRSEPRLTLDDRCQGGMYSALFRRRKGNARDGALKTKEKGE